MSDGVVFSKIPAALTKTTRPWRALEGSAKPPTVARVFKWLAKEYIAKKASYWQYSNKQLFERGLAASKKTPFLKQRTEACALLASLSVEALVKPSLETLAFAERMVWHLSSDESIAPAIAEARGLTDALRVVMRASKLGTEMSGGYTNAVYIVGTEGRTTRGEPKPLRHLLCAASKKDYDEAKRCAEELRKKGDGGDRILLAYLFPDEDWGSRALIEELDARQKAPTTNQYRDDNHAWTLLSATRDATTVRRWLEEVGAYHVSTYAIELACVLSPKDSVPIFADAIAKMLVKPKYGPLHKTPPRDTAHALGCIDSKEAAAALAPYANNTILGPQVLAWFHDHPKHGAVLAAHAKGKGKLEATTARVLRVGKKESGDAKPIAAAKEIPSILRDLPWRGGGGAKKGAKKTERVVLTKPLAILGLELEKIKLARPVKRRVADDPLNIVREMNKSELAAWKKEAAKKKTWTCCDFDRTPKQVGGSAGKYEFKRVPDREGLARWNERGESTTVEGEVAWVERHGMKALPGFSHRDWIKWLSWEGNEETFDAIRSMISPRVASSIARVASRRKHYRRTANAWLVENAEVAAYGLIPDALGSKTEERADAEGALLLLKNQGHDALVRKVAKKYGTKEVEKGIAALLDRDPLAIEASVPKRPSFLRVDELPQVLLKNGKKAVDDEARSAIVEMLQIASIDAPYPGLELVRNACDEASLGALALELVEQWVIGDAPGRHEWMLFSMLHFRSERATRRVSELAREWARKNQAKALRACTALSEDGSDLALMHLAHIAETTRFAALKKDAGELVRQAAAVRGLTEDELGDRTVPDAGLGADGTITLSYGPAREFVVSLSPSLDPVVREKTKSGLGAPEKTIPRASKTDDAALAKKARERFDELKKDLAAIAQRQVRRLERAMALGRSWPVKELETRIASHPLLRAIARALVWDASGKLFRIAEDGSYADANDKTVKLPVKGTAVRIAHPAHLSPADLKAWSSIFGDYEIIAPFEQLGRVVTVPSANEKKAKELARAASIDAPARKMLGTMESRGWRRNDAGYVTAWLRSLPSNLEARWPIKPGISMESLSMGGGGGGASSDVVTTENLVVMDAKNKPVTLGSIDAALFSEIVRDVEAVRNLEP